MKADGERAELAVGRGTFLKSVIGTAVAVATVAVTPKEAPASSVAGELCFSFSVCAHCRRS